MYLIQQYLSISILVLSVESLLKHVALAFFVEPHTALSLFYSFPRNTAISEPSYLYLIWMIAIWYCLFELLAVSITRPEIIAYTQIIGFVNLLLIITA